ncbi:MAG: multicopper oxidase domain-containing protein [Treponemataceae bacterium]|nr:multicopper oxidase domain-containing protein [Treponemataceae bacterium]
MERITRRDFIKYGAGGLAAIVVGSQMDWLENKAEGAVRAQTLKFRITDAIKEMVTHNSLNTAECYFWIYKEERFPADCPGPTIFTTQGDVVRIEITNDLDEPHSFFIPGIFNSGPIAPGQTIKSRFVAKKTGTFLYYDNLNPPVNRVMGLHGAFIVMPRAPRPGHKFTPYEKPTPQVQMLFDDLGTSVHFPGLSWEEGDESVTPHTMPFRQYVWLLHQASPRLFQEVGELQPGRIFDRRDFVDRFLNDEFIATSDDNRVPPINDRFNRKPHFFTINGQSGYFSHHNPYITPHHRVGEPVVIRVLNAGLWMHSLHIHAAHVFVIAINGRVQNNPIWVDTFDIYPLGTFDWLVPFTRPPDVPNLRGIGFPDTPLICLANPRIPGSTPHPVWPPIEEINFFFPAVGTLANPADPNSPDLSVQLSPLCFPMHDHNEPSQVAQGGNYNLRMMAGIIFTGDRTLPGGVVTFPNAPLEHPHNETGPAAGPEDH